MDQRQDRGGPDAAPDNEWVAGREPIDLLVMTHSLRATLSPYF
jgi:hypothetical protein